MQFKCEGHLKHCSLAVIHVTDFSRGQLDPARPARGPLPELLSLLSPSISAPFLLKSNQGQGLQGSDSQQGGDFAL